MTNQHSKKCINRKLLRPVNDRFGRRVQLVNVTLYSLYKRWTLAKHNSDVYFFSQISHIPRSYEGL